MTERDYSADPRSKKIDYQLQQAGRGRDQVDVNICNHTYKVDDCPNCVVAIPDQVDALDEIIVKLMIDTVFLAHGELSFTQDETMTLRKVAKAKLSAREVAIRIDEQMKFRSLLTRPILDSDARIKELEKQREAQI